MWACGCGEVGRRDAAATYSYTAMLPIGIVNRQCVARELDPQMRLANDKEGAVCRFNRVGTT